MWIFMILLGGLLLFIIIAGAVKVAVREVLYEFKEDIIKELELKKANEENKNDN